MVGLNPNSDIFSTEVKVPYMQENNKKSPLKKKQNKKNKQKNNQPVYSLEDSLDGASSKPLGNVHATSH